MAIEYNDGIFVWVLYSETTGDILRVLKDIDGNSDQVNIPKGYKWGTFITTSRSLNNIFKYRVTKSGLEKTVNRYLVTK